MARPLALPLVLDRAAGPPLSSQVAGQIRDGIVAGTLPVGARLPSTRSLAADLGVSRAVTEQAFDQLTAEGWTEGRHGSGTFVAAGAAHPPASPAGPCSGARAAPAPSRHRDPVDRPPAPRRLAPRLARRLRGARSPVVRRSRGAARPARRARHPPGADPRPALRPRRDPGDHGNHRRPEPAARRTAAGRRRPRGPRLPSRRRGDPRVRARDRDLPATEPVTDLDGRCRRLRDTGPPAPARPGHARLRPAVPARRGGARRRGRDRGRLRLGVPLRRRTGPGARRPRPRPGGLRRHGEQERRPQHAAGLAGRARPPAPRDPGRGVPSPTTSPPGRCNAPSCPCSATATSTRWSAPPAGRTPYARHASPTRCDPTPSRSCRWPACTPPSRCPRPARCVPMRRPVRRGSRCRC